MESSARNASHNYQYLPIEYEDWKGWFSRETSLSMPFFSGSRWNMVELQHGNRFQKILESRTLVNISQLRTLIALGHGEVIRPAAVIRFDRKWSVTTAIQRTTSIRKRALEEKNPWKNVEGHLFCVGWGLGVLRWGMVRWCRDIQDHLWRGEAMRL